MKIATLGSWEGPDSDFATRGGEEAFYCAAKQIGNRIARKGHPLVVGVSRHKTADYNAVRGVLRVTKEEGAAKLEPGSIEVIRPSTDSARYEEFAQEKKYQVLFRFYEQGALSVNECKLMAVKRADVVLTLGGGEGTYLAGLAALVARKPLVPTPSFGGASSLLMQKAREFGEHQIVVQLEKLSAGPWTEFLLNTTLDVAGVNKLPKIMIVHGHSEDRLKLEKFLISLKPDALIDTSPLCQ